MTLHTLLLDLFIALFALPCPWLQFRQLRKTGTSEGLSTAFMFLALCSSLSWFSYGFSSHEPLQLVINSSGTMANLLCLAMMIRYTPRVAFVGPLVVAFYVSFFIASLVFGGAVFGLAGTVVGTFSRMPQVYRSWREPGGVAVSVSSFALGTFVSLLWVAFAVANKDWFVFASATLAIVTGSYIIARTRQQPAQQVVPAVVEPNVIPA